MCFVKTRLALITEIIAPYRIPVFNALANSEDVELHVIFLAENDASLRQWLVYKDEIQFSYQVLPSWRGALGNQNVLFNWGVARALSAARPDIVICGGYNYPASWRAAYWAKHRRIPFLLWIESTSLDRRTMHFFVEKLKLHFLDLCTGFVVPGRASTEYLRRLGVSEDRIFVAPNAIDIHLFQDAAARARQEAGRLREALRLPARYFLDVGRLVEAKGAFDLIDAYAKLNAALRAEVSLLFLGDGVAREALAARSRAILPGSIEFRGFIQRDALPAFYALAEALVFPTHSDTWGFVVNEAMACGTPVIVSEVAGCVPDLVQNFETGILVPSQDAASIAESLAFLAERPGTGVEMARRATKLISQYSPAAWAAGIASAVASMGGHR
jgi:glycosyltransferase involved in cell wall biosynthesis